MLEIFLKKGNALVQTTSSDPACCSLRLPGLHIPHTSRCVTDDDMVIGLAIITTMHIMSAFILLLFLTVTAKCTLKMLRSIINYFR